MNSNKCGIGQALEGEASGWGFWRAERKEREREGDRWKGQPGKNDAGRVLDWMTIGIYGVGFLDLEFTGEGERLRAEVEGWG